MSITSVQLTHALPLGKNEHAPPSVYGRTANRILALLPMQLQSCAGTYVKFTRATASHAAVAWAISLTTRALRLPKSSVTQ